MRRNPREVKCKVCGQVFLTKSNNALYCVDCRYKTNKERSQKWRDGTKTDYKKEKFKKNYHSKTLDETLADIREYNKKHGTRLSYGQYKVLQHFGKV